MSSLGAIFKRGLWILMPAMITLAALGLIYNICEGGWYGQALRYLVQSIAPSVYARFPEGQGVSFLTTGLLVLLLGAIGSIAPGRYVLNLVNWFLSSTPIIRTFYGPALNVSEVFLDDDPNSQKISFQRVVKIPVAVIPITSRGLVSGEPVTGLPIMVYGLVAGEEVREGVTYLDIFIPHSPTFSSGITIEAPEDVCISVPWTIEAAVRFLVSCGLLKPELKSYKETPPPDAP